MMEEIESLTPETRTVALVGRFLQGWAVMEASLNKAIGKTLGLASLPELVVTKNISLRDKIHILRTVLTLSSFQKIPREARAKYDTALVQIANYSGVRNMMAHDMFFPSKDGKGVDFFVVKAKGELKIPDEVWSSKKFWEEYTKLNEWDDVVRDLISHLTEIPASDVPSGLIFGLGPETLLSPNSLWPQTSNLLGASEPQDPK